MAPGPVETAEKQDTEHAVPTKLPKGVVLGPDGKP
jgi:FAD-linked sulfhydryl oxidase